MPFYTDFALVGCFRILSVLRVISHRAKTFSDFVVPFLFVYFFPIRILCGTKHFSCPPLFLFFSPLYERISRKKYIV